MSVVNPKLISNVGDNSLRAVKTDKADAKKIAKYGLTNWSDLREYTPQSEIRKILKTHNRQYNQYSKIKTILKNNLIALLEQTFPDIRNKFTSPVREDGHEKWVDFAEKFWHCDCVKNFSRAKFHEQYRKWCHKHKYIFNYF